VHIEFNAHRAHQYFHIFITRFDKINLKYVFRRHFVHNFPHSKFQKNKIACIKQKVGLFGRHLKISLSFCSACFLEPAACVLHM